MTEPDQPARQRYDVGLHALPKPPPGGLGRWAKVAWKTVETIATGVAWMAYDYADDIFGIGDEAAGGEATQWRRWSLVWSNTASQLAADDQVFSFDVINYTNGSIDNTWTDLDYANVAANVDIFLEGITPYLDSSFRCDQGKVYVMAYAALPANWPQPGYNHFAESGPPEYEWSPQKPGGGTSAMAWQVCSTLTERTPVRKHWGRCYLPTIGQNAIGTNGRLVQNAVDGLASAYGTLLTTLSDSEFHVVVPSVMVNGKPGHVLQTVSSIAVDDVPDIQRRRRPREPQYQHVVPAPSAAQQPA